MLRPFCNRTIRFLKVVLLFTSGSFWSFWTLTPYQLDGWQILPPFPGLALPRCGCSHNLCRRAFLGRGPSCLVLLLSPELGACSPLMSTRRGSERFSLPQTVLGKLGGMNLYPYLTPYTHTQMDSKWVKDSKIAWLNIRPHLNYYKLEIIE